MPLALARWTTGCSRLRMPPTLVRLPAAPSHGLALSYRVLRAPSRHPPFHALACRTRGSSHEVCSPSAYPRTRQRPHGAACLTTPPAPSGFLDLSTLWSATCLSALFHAESAHGVAPYRALLPSHSRTPSPAPLPSWRWKHTSSNLQRDAQRHAEAHLENISSAGLTRRAEARCPHPKPLDRTYPDPKTEARRSYGATARWCAETQHLAAAQPTSRKTETLHGAQATSGCATQAPLHLWLPAWSTQHRSASSSTGEPTTAPHPKVRTRNRQQVNPV
jgi:hypothetical protein